MSIKITLQHTWNKLRYLFTYLLLIFYWVISFLFLFTDVWADMIPKGRGAIGLVLFLFGCIRFYVAYKRYKKKKIRIELLKKAKTQVANTNTVTSHTASI